MWTGMEGADLQVARLLHTEKAIIPACNLAGAPTIWTLRHHTNKHSFTLLHKSTAGEFISVDIRIYFCSQFFLAV